MPDEDPKPLQYTFDGEPPATSTNGPTSQPIDLQAILDLAAALPPPPPKANPDQCRFCGMIIGRHFGGLVDVTPIAIRGPGAFSPIAAFACPACAQRLLDRLQPPSAG